MINSPLYNEKFSPISSIFTQPAKSQPFLGKDKYHQKSLRYFSLEFKVFINSRFGRFGRFCRFCRFHIFWQPVEI